MDAHNLQNFIKNLMGIKYTFWTKGSTKIAPTYGENKPIPNLQFLKDEGINCAGLINLIKRFIMSKIPIDDKYPGGTHIWYKFLKKKKYLKIFNKNLKYPKYTLFLKKYKNVNNQGHLSLVWEDKKSNPYLLQSLPILGGMFKKTWE